MARLDWKSGSSVAFVALALGFTGCASSEEAGACGMELYGSVGEAAVAEVWDDATVMRSVKGDQIELDVASSRRRLFVVGDEGYLFGPGPIGGFGDVLYASGVGDTNGGSSRLTIGGLSALGAWPGQEIAGDLELCTMKGSSDQKPLCNGHVASLSGNVGGAPLDESYSAATQYAAGDHVVVELWGQSERVLGLIAPAYALVVRTRTADGSKTIFTARQVSIGENGAWRAKLSTLGALESPPGKPLGGQLVLDSCR